MFLSDRPIVELRWALRRLGRTWRRTLSVVVLLGLTIGITATACGELYAVAFRQLPYPNAGELVTARWTGTSAARPSDLVSLRQYREWRQRARSIDNLGVYRTGVSCLVGGDPVVVPGAVLSAAVVRLAVPLPIVGRPLGEADEIVAGQAVGMISYGTWQRYFQSSRVLTSRILRCRVPGSDDVEAVTVVGVAPEGFSLPYGEEVGVWLPLRPAVGAAGTDVVRAYHLLGRLRPQVSIADASRELSRMVISSGRESKMESVRVLSLLDSVTGSVKPSLWLFVGAVTLVYALVCTTVAMLLAVRRRNDDKETGVRLAIGATRWELAGQYFVEVGLLTAGAAAVSVLVAAICIRAFAALADGIIPRVGELNVDAAILVPVALLALVTPFIIGTVPALTAARRSPASLLTACGSSGRRNPILPLGRSLVAVQVGLAVVVLMGTAQLTAGFARLARVDLGFNPRGLLAVQVRTPRFEWNPDARQHWRLFYSRLLDELNGASGVVGAGAIDALPLEGTSATWTFSIVGRPALAAEEAPSVQRRTVAGEYYRTMGIRLRKGRVFSPRDTSTSEHVAIINDAMAREFWPKDEPLNSVVAFANDRYRVVGVVDTVRHFGPAEAGRPEIYVWHPQAPTASMVVLVRSSGGTDPVALVRRSVGRDSHFEIAAIQRLEDILQRYWALPRLWASISALFGTSALALAVSGVFLLQHHLMRSRMREFGIRCALGATPGEVGRLALWSGAVPVVVGFACSAVAAPPLGALLASLVGPLPLPTWRAVGLAMVGLGAPSLLAGYLPAKRASSEQVATWLRVE